MVKEILTESIKFGAFDIHFSVGNYPVIRISDNLTFLEDKGIINQEFMEEMVFSMLNTKQKEALEKEKEIIFSYNFDKSLRFKVNIFYQRGFLSATLRYIQSQVPTLEELGLSDLKDLSKLKRGLVIISGPFGSGRSSTVASLINEINKSRKEYIITIEEPIEFLFSNNKSIIEQREVGKDTNSFQDALAYFQEEDGDVLFVDKMNDVETIPITLEIAASSLVFTVVTANSAQATISSIVDNFQSFDQGRVRDMLAASLKAVLCQKMIPKIGGGVKVVYEYLPVNDAVRSTIQSGDLKQLDNIINTSRKSGMISLEQSLAAAVKSGEIEVGQAMENAKNLKLLENLLA